MQPVKVLPDDDVGGLSVAVELVTTLPWESSILMTGCVVIEEPAAAPATGCVVNCSCVAAPACDGVNCALVAVIAVPAPLVRPAVNVYGVPALPAN